MYAPDLPLRQPACQPLPGFSLHFGVELMRRIVDGAAELFRLTGFAVAVGELLVPRLDAGEVEQPVLAAVDVELRARHRQRRDIWIIHFAIKSGDEFRRTDRV